MSTFVLYFSLSDSSLFVLFMFVCFIFMSHQTTFQVSSYGGYLRYRLHTQPMRGDVLSLPAEASRPDIILKVPNARSHHLSLDSDTQTVTDGQSHTSCSRPLQGNQMTLVFMEREYSSPEEPHLGIVHMVEVSSIRT